MTKDELIAKLEGQKEAYERSIEKMQAELDETNDIITAVNNSKAMKPKKEILHGSDGEESTIYWCGKCGHIVMKGYDNYCDRCGVKLDWSEEEDHENND